MPLDFMKSAIRWLRGVIHRMRAGIVVSNAEYEAIVDRVKSVADGIECLSDEALQAAFNDFRQRRISKAKSEVLRVEALAIVREAARRSLKMRPYDVQMLAAAAMLDNKCVEMQTGEGKTLVAAVTNCINAATGYGVHVLTFNEYLAKRDARWMAPLYHFLNLTVGHIAQGMSPKERRDAYLCDITYVTAKQALFDFLRDHRRFPVRIPG